MKHRILSIAAWLSRRAENLAALMLASMFLTFLIQIVFRYFFNLPLGWTIEFSGLTWIWGILFGYAFIVRETDVVRFDIIYATVSPRVARVFDILGGLGIAAIFIASFPAVVDYVLFMKIEKTAFLRVRFDLAFSVYLAFAVSVVIRSLWLVWRAVAHKPILVHVATEGLVE